MSAALQSIEASATDATGEQALTDGFHLIIDALKRNDWNRLATAQELGIHKSTLYRRLASLGIQPPEHDGRSRS